jgi:RecA-family ATPase
MNSILEAALDMARRGFRVFPALPNSKHPFEWNPNIPEKRNCSPKDLALRGGVRIATQDEEKIRSWFAHRLDPDFEYDCDEINYGVSCNGMIVVDVDVKKGKDGINSLRAIGQLPGTFTVVTPSGGYHLYYAGAECGQKPLADGIDIRSRNGYVIGPGCNIDNYIYHIRDDRAPVQVPDFLWEKLKPGANAGNEQTTIPLTDLDLPVAVQMAIEFVKREPVAMPGGRNITAFAILCNMKDFGVSPDLAAQILNEHWNSRLPEPLSDGEVQHVTTSAYSSGRYAPGVRNPDTEFKDIKDALIESQIFPGNVDPDSFRLIKQGREPHELPARPWLVPGLMIKSSVTAIVAQPGARKSTFTVALACGFALGDLKFLGLQYRGEGPINVMLVNNEDDEDEITRRVYACCKTNGLDFHKAMAKIYIHAPRNAAPFVAVGKQEGKPAKTAQYDLLRTAVKLHDIGVVVLDPLADMHTCSENDNSEMAQVMSAIRELARSDNLSAVVVHHSRKPDTASSRDYAGDPFSSRGASAIHGNVRVLATLCTASEEDGFEHLGVTPPKHLDYSRLDLGKGSYSPAGKHTKWYICESQRVGPPDCDDTAPALKFVNRRDQVQRQIESIHRALDIAAAGQKTLEMDDAIRAASDELANLGYEEAERCIQVHFRTPQQVNGTTIQYVKEGRKKPFISVS